MQEMLNVTVKSFSMRHFVLPSVICLKGDALALMHLGKIFLILKILFFKLFQSVCEHLIIVSPA